MTTVREITRIEAFQTYLLWRAQYGPELDRLTPEQVARLKLIDRWFYYLDLRACGNLFPVM